jgi:hypothetical protein
MRRQLFGTVAALLLGTAFAPAMVSPAMARPTIGQPIALTEATKGCSDLKVWARILDFLNEKDTKAATALFFDNYGTCRLIAAGTSIITEDYSWLYNAYCIRPVGDPVDCVWTNARQLNAD